MNEKLDLVLTKSDINQTLQEKKLRTHLPESIVRY